MKATFNRFLECGVLLRLYTMGMSSLYCYTSLTQPGSQLYAIAHASPAALVAMYALGLFALLGSIDVLVNDIMPERFVIRPALRDRHLVSMGMALCFAVQMWTCVRLELPAAPMPFYAVYVVMIPLSAFADVNKRFNPRKAC